MSSIVLPIGGVESPELLKKLKMSRTDIFNTTYAISTSLLPAIVLAASIFVSACVTSPLLPYSKDATPLVLVPTSQAGVLDKRGRFREIFCAILEERGPALPDYRPCDDALVRVGPEPNGTGNSVDLEQSNRQLVAVIVPGVGWDCFSDWLDLKDSVQQHVHQFGYDEVILKVDSLSGSTNNARQIRDAIMTMQPESAEPNLVLIGYSKGAPDILEAIVSYPEVHKRVAAVVSAAGAIGGSPLANDATQSQLELMRHWPKAQCSIGDGGALESLRPATRKAWLSKNPLPPEIPFYSLVTYPNPERISTVLLSSYEKLSRVDARNDGQLLFYDQIIPGSTLLGYVNADHWALTVPIARSHSMLGSTFVDHNHYPREALLEALLRFVEEDLATSAR
jgi:hypothetical protein